jgi:hypothetical protein|uniref:Uncharacterized protein n=1 Tax=viral metagenome TaxID=1070528 RepID=A0A6C0CF08_9ZZZZ
MFLYSLRFSIIKDIHLPIFSNWLRLKNICEYNINNSNKVVVDGWLANCRSEEIKTLSYLYRYEGGLGMEINKNKQLRFRTHLHSEKDNDIVLRQYYIDKNKNKWTDNNYEDLINGFIKYSNNLIVKETDFKRGNYVTGRIELY